MESLRDFPSESIYYEDECEHTDDNGRKLEDADLDVFSHQLGEADGDDAENNADYTDD